MSFTHWPVALVEMGVGNEASNCKPSGNCVYDYVRTKETSKCHDIINNNVDFISSPVPQSHLMSRDYIIIMLLYGEFQQAQLRMRQNKGCHICTFDAILYLI